MIEKKEIIIEFDELVPEVIKNLNRKEDAWVYQKLVKKFVKNIHDFESYDEIFEVIALNPNTSIETLHLLKKFEDEDVRENLALNPNTPITILKKLLKDNSPYVRMALLKRDDISPKLIEILFNDNGKYFDDDEYYRDEYDDGYDDNDFNATIEELEQLTNELKSVIDDEDDYYYEDEDEDDEYSSVEYMEDDVSSEIKILIASNDRTPLTILKQLSNHEDEEVREALAMNKNIDFSTLEKLSEDGSDDVKAAILLRNDGDLKIKLCIGKHIEWIHR